MKTFITIGETQQGKSSFIKSRTGKSVAIGNGRDSCTKSPELITSSKEKFIDSQGLHDTDIVKTDKQIIEELMATLLQSKEDFGGFLLFQSARATGCQYKRVLQFLQTIFGDEHKTMTMVIVTYSTSFATDANEKEHI